MKTSLIIHFVFDSILIVSCMVAATWGALSPRFGFFSWLVWCNVALAAVTVLDMRDRWRWRNDNWTYYRGGR